MLYFFTKIPKLLYLKMYEDWIYFIGQLGHNSDVAMHFNYIN